MQFVTLQCSSHDKQLREKEKKKKEKEKLGIELFGLISHNP